MMAPTMLAAAAILSAVNRYGTDAGRRTFQKIVQRDAAYERISSTARGSGERRPRISAMVTGKNVRYVAMMTTEVRPRPKPTTMSGARATIGHRLAGDDVGHEGPLGEREVDEDRGEDDADEGAQREADDRLAPGVERGLDEVLPERATSWLALERLAAGPPRCPTGAAAGGRTPGSGGTAAWK